MKLSLLGLVALATLVTVRPTFAQTSELYAGETAYEAGRLGEAQQQWLKAAETGNAQAAFDIGLLHDIGEGVPENAEVAFQWYLRAARENLPDGQLNVGVMYDSGRGVAADKKQAAIWYARAAIQGNARAAFNLGQLCQNGEGLNRNPAVARAWYELAARQIPAANARAKALSNQPVGDGQSALMPPTPAWPTSSLKPIAQGDAIQLVWLAPPEPTHVVYFVELGRLREGHFQELASAYAPVSAYATTLSNAGTFAWRVYVVSIDGSEYVASPWSVFVKTADEPEVVSTMPLAPGP